MENVNGHAIIKRVEQRPHEMDGHSLEILERIARNLPVHSVQLSVANTDDGKIYLAWGKDSVGCYHGLWGARGFARTIEFQPAVVDEEVVRGMLTEDALWLLRQMKQRDILDAGWFQHGKA